ncbi:acyltransferase family protein [Pseudarthrobacter scleromae]|uniref:Acyltransferase n=1 Tax=Pseudarthrobacter scleromae TaxID=158897 RepID=A0ABQ2CBV4_9MICC|nr:acyltransferase family protein [Pseudarthrobacter scleromae]GGI69356.1 acyltransferase [Pseudarthrobacter scleromae]
MSMLKIRRKASGGVKPSSKLRGDIQGLRALAVTAVIFDHLLHWPSGGFVGVDIFFVISGFLITGILAKEFTRTGHISFTGFYTRRIRRIIPVSLLVLAATVLTAKLLYTASNFESVLWDSIASFFFVGNWRYAATGTDYFAAGGSPSPLQHFWSLAVEEQFYFVWPWLMLGILLLVTKLWKVSAPRAVRISGLAMAVAIIASFAWALEQSSSAPTVAYFSSLTRTWELGVGALLALFAGAFVGIPAAARTLLAWLGTAGMLASIFFVTSGPGFPAPGGVFPVAATAAVIAAGIGAEAKHNYLLTNPVSRYLGDVSYSLYLWHFPVIIFLGVFYPEGGIAYTFIALGLTLALSVASYHLVEKPFNKAPILVKHDSKTEGRRAWQKWRTAHASVFQNGGLLALTVTTAVVVAIVLVRPTSSPSAEEAAAYNERLASTGAGTSAPAAPVADTPRSKILGGLSAALATAAWPKLSPSVDNVMAEGMPMEATLGCGAADVFDPMSCGFGNPSNPEVVVFGDSLGTTLMPTVREALESDYYVRGLTLAACAVIDLEVEFESEAVRDNCLNVRAEAVRYIQERRPEAVLVIENYAWANSKKLTSRAAGEAMQEEWRAAAQSFISKVSGSTKRVVFVAPPPEGKQLADCASKVSTPSSCVSDIPGTWQQVREVESKLDGATYLDTLHWFCVSGKCPSFSGTTPIKRDFIHPTQQYAQQVAVDFREMYDQIP